MRARYSKGTEVEVRPTLAQVGIDKKLSSRSQAIASIPDDEIESAIAERAKANQKQSEGRGAKGLSKLTNLIDPVDTRKEASKMAGVSEGTYHMAINPYPKSP